jgi:hypothetical protein
MRTELVAGLVGVVALGAGIGIGVAVGDDSAEVAETQQVAERRSDEIGRLKEQVAQARQAAADADKKAEEEARKRFSERRKQLDAREKKLDERSRAINAREREVSGMEREYEANTIPGDGRYRVGSDIQPGTYRAESAPSGSCYWARLSADDGGIDSIINNGNVSGPVTITVAPSDHTLELSGCADFHKVTG